MNETNFISADLHVHTPASKCYKGESSDDEYLNILRNYKKKNIKIIGITDHNTILGYREIIRIKSEVEQKIKILNTYKEKIPELEVELNSLQSDIKIFQDLLILPGVEFEANPGIHLLFLFNPEQDLSKIDTFLENSGFSQSIQGQENPEIEIKVDVLEALKLAKELNALTIAAHVDSNKGIYNDLNGLYRSRVFKSDFLDGASVNNVVQIEKIKNLLSQPDYKRNKPLALIQSSDHHQLSQCGSKVTYLNVNDLSFSALIECFKNPVSNISPTAKPEIKNIINQLANDKNTIIIEDINEDVILSSACALLNNNYGTILIGITNDQYKNIKGINVTKTSLKLLKDSIVKLIDPGKIFYKLDLLSVPFGDKEVIIISLQNISNKSFFYKSKHFYLNNEKVCESTAEIMLDMYHDISNSLLEQFYTSHDSRLASINKELQLLMETKYSINIIKKVNDEGITLAEILDVEILHYNEKIKIETNLPYGSNGGLVYFTKYHPPRADDCYIRCTCPSTDTIEFVDESVKSGVYLVLCPGGGAHIIDCEKFNIYNAFTKYPSLLLKLTSDFNYLNPFVILAWLKSSVLLWYAYSIFGEFDIHTASIFRNIKIPVSLFHNDTSSFIEQKIKEIITLESEFLLEQESLSSKYEGDELEGILSKLADSHNRKVDSYALDIDNTIKKILSITDEEDSILENFLILKDLHTLESK